MTKYRGSLTDDFAWPKPKLQSADKIDPDAPPAPDQFFLEAANKYDHSVSIRTGVLKYPIKIAEAQHAALMALVEDKTNPYRSIPDIIRDAIVHRLWAHKILGRTGSPKLRQYLAINSMIGALAELEAERAAVQSLKEQLTELAGATGYKQGRIRKLLATLKHHVGNLSAEDQGELRDLIAVVEKKLLTTDTSGLDDDSEL